MNTRRLGLALPALLAIALLARPASANEQLQGRTYHFGTHPARTNITFVSEADLETIHGVTNAVQGAVRIDATGRSASGVLQAGVRSMKTGIDLRDEHMRSEQWLDAKRHPWIRLQVVKAVESEDGRTWDYTALLTIKGTTREMKGKARVTAIPDRLARALGPGSWLRVRTAFDVRLSDFGIQVPQTVGAKVSPTWAISIDVYGTTVLPKRRR